MLLPSLHRLPHKQTLRRELLLALGVKFILLFIIWLFFFSGDTETVDSQSVKSHIFNTR